MNVRSLAALAFALWLAAPAQAQEDGHWRCGTPALLPVLQHGWDALTPQQQQLAWDVVGPGENGQTLPVMGASCTGTAPNEQESEHFVVKWGPNYNGTGVDETLEAMETARAMFTETLGYQEPYGVGGATKMPIFVGNSGGGMPTIGWSGGYTTVCGDTASAYIVLSQNLDSWSFVADVGPHELYHAVQMGYNAWNVDGWYWEASATWSEDLAYPELNGYVWFLDQYTSAPETALDLENYSHEYGMFIFPMAIEEFIPDGIEVMRKIWEQPGSGNIPDAMGAILEADHSHSFDDAFAEFAARTALMDDFEDGAIFNRPQRVVTTGDLPDGNDAEDSRPAGRYGSNFLEIQAPGDAQPPNTKLRFEFDGGGAGTWILGAIKHRTEDGVNKTFRTPVEGDGTALMEVIDFGSLYDTVVVNVSWTGSGSAPAYAWSAEMVEQTEPEGDDDDDDDGADDDDGGVFSGCLATPSPYSYNTETSESANACAVARGGSGVASAAVMLVLGGMAWWRRR